MIDEQSTVRSRVYRVLDPNGPRVVAIGGGHGLARSLGALRHYASTITAVVSVADDGGSSGRLRAAFGIPAPGDLRRCLSALLPGPSPLGDALEHRFDGGELAGHAFGNLLLAALTESCGDFVGAVQEACRLLSTVGAVLPSSRSPVTLRATAGAKELEGQVAIMESTGVTRVTLDPPDVEPPREVFEAVESADQIVIGPGSLFTSVLAALAPVGMTEAIARARGLCVYVCNLREQDPETKGHDVADHVRALREHGVRVDVVLADTTEMARGDLNESVRLVETLLSSGQRAVHDEALLGEALEGLTL